MKLNKNIILAEVNNLVNISGFNSVTFAQIASKLSTTRENIHHHFKTKEKLSMAYIAYLHQFLENYFTQISKKNLTNEQKLMQYFDIYNMHSNNYASCPLASLLADFKLLPKSTQKSLKILLDFELECVKNIILNALNKKINKDEVYFIVAILRGAVLYEKASYKLFNIMLIKIKNNLI